MHRSLVRSSILSAYAPHARACGLDPGAMLREVGLPLRSLVDPDLQLRVGAVSRLLETTALRGGAPDFGLRLARTRTLSSLGELGALMRDERTVRDAVRRAVESAHLNSTAIWMHLSERAGVALVRLAIDADREPTIRQSTEMALGGLFRILRDLLGAGWHPREIRFVHDAVSEPATYRRHFGCGVRFCADFNGIVLSSDELDRPIPLSDGRLRRYALLAESRPPPGAATESRVRTLIRVRLTEGRCTVEDVATALGVDRRTLHRRLSAGGRTFSGVLDEVRLELAQQALHSERADVTRIAERTGFGSLSAFSRWFKRRTGAAPTRWAGRAARRRS